VLKQPNLSYTKSIRMKKNDSRILFYVSGESDPSPRFRFHQFINPLRELGLTVDVVTMNPIRNQALKYSKIPVLKKLEQAYFLWKRTRTIHKMIQNAACYDLIFTNKDLVPNLNVRHLEKKLAAVNKNLVFDIDDAIYFGKRGEKLKETLPNYKAVIAGSPILGNYVSENFGVRSYYIPMAIDTSKYKPVSQRPAGKFRIGWSGSHHTNVHALPLLQKPLEELAKRIDFEFIVVSNVDPELSWNVDSRFIQWTEKSEVNAIQLFDVGLMPLQDSEFERGKCALKAVQYMAVGVPPVVSPVGVNAQIVRDGEDGYHFKDNDELLEKLVILSENIELRNTMGTSAYTRVLENYSIDVLKHEYARVFDEIIHS